MKKKKVIVAILLSPIFFVGNIIICFAGAIALAIDDITGRQSCMDYLKRLIL